MDSSDNTSPTRQLSLLDRALIRWRGVALEHPYLVHIVPPIVLVVVTGILLSLVITPGVSTPLEVGIELVVVVIAFTGPFVIAYYSLSPTACCDDIEPGTRWTQ